MNHDDVIAVLSTIRDRERLGNINVKHLDFSLMSTLSWDFLKNNGYICLGQDKHKYAGARYILTFLGHVKLAAEKDKNETS